MKACLFILFFASTIPIEAHAQLEQSTVLAKMGIVRMVTRQVNSNNIRGASDRTYTTETFFDSLGRTLRSEDDVCSGCGKIYEFDSITGLVSYSRFTSLEGITETFTEYDDKKRRIRSKTCSSKKDDCETNYFDYDEENTERMYKLVTRRHINRDTTRHAVTILGLSTSQVEEKQLLYEKFYSPEGQLEEQRHYKDGKFQYSSLYEYDKHGYWIRIWNFDEKIKILATEAERNENGQCITLKNCIWDFTKPLIAVNEPIVYSFEYDENGLLLRKTSGKSTWEYSYFTD